jgi:hypothetical protein
MDSAVEHSSHDLSKSAATISAMATSHTAEPSGKQESMTAESSTGEHYGWRFWMIIASLCMTSLLTAIEATVTATALPTIARELDSRELYVWFVNAIFLSR